MELRLSAEIELALDHESKSLGISAAEFSARLLAEHVHRAKARSAPREGEIDQYMEWILQRNPDLASHDPYAVDWQAIKALGRKY